MFGADFLTYYYDKKQGTRVSDDITKLLFHDHESAQQDAASPIANPNHSITTGSTSNNHIPISNTLKPSVSSVLPNPSRLQANIANAKTRSELSKLCSELPPVTSYSCNENLKAKELKQTTNPFQISQRPYESIVKKAEDLLKKEKKKFPNRSLCVVISAVGKISNDGQSVLSKFCEIVEIAHAEERQWLNQFQSSAGIRDIEMALWEQPCNYPLLRYGKKCIDVQSFSDVVGERWIDNFVIDVSLGKFLQDAQNQGNDNTLYFPSDLFEWVN